MLAIRRDNRRYLARASHPAGRGSQSGDRVDSAPGLDRSAKVLPGGPVLHDCVRHRADRALRHGARAVGLVSDADVVTDFQQSDPAASGPDLLWTVSMAAIVRGQSECTLVGAAEIPNKRDRSAGNRRTIVLVSGSKISKLERKSRCPNSKPRSVRP